jgi:hypothetical protein
MLPKVATPKSPNACRNWLRDIEMSDQHESFSVIAALELLRRADEPYGHPKNWLKRRRLAVVAACCKDRPPLIEVMETNPPCVLVGGAAHGSTAAERKPWQGVGRRGEGYAWLSTFERMAGTNIRYWTWCEHHRWYVSAAPAPKAVAGEAIWIPLDHVVTKRGRHVVPLADR